MTVSDFITVAARAPTVTQAGTVAVAARALAATAAAAFKLEPAASFCQWSESRAGPQLFLIIPLMGVPQPIY